MIFYVSYVSVIILVLHDLGDDDRLTLCLSRFLCFIQVTPRKNIILIASVFLFLYF